MLFMVRLREVRRIPNFHGGGVAEVEWADRVLPVQQTYLSEGRGKVEDDEEEELILLIEATGAELDGTNAESS